MSDLAGGTRARLIEAATREFAENGIATASLLEITRQAEQRNRGAVHYHFGSRTGLLVAVIDQFADLLAAREHELLTQARTSPEGDLTAVVRALIVPAVELADLGSRGRQYLAVLAQLTDEDPDTVDDEVSAALARTGGVEAYDLLESRCPPMPDWLRSERLSLTSSFILRAIAARGRASEHPTSRPQLATDPFARNLEAMVVAMICAPVDDLS